MKGKSGLGFILIVLIVGILTYLAFNGVPALGIPSVYDTRLGIDIRGGVGTTLYPDLPEGQVPDSKELEAASTVIENRLNEKGIFDRYMTIENEHGRIILEIPYKQGESDLNPQKTIDELGNTALLTFQEVDEEKYDGMTPEGLKNYLPTGKIIIEGKDVEDAGVQTNPQTGQVVVTLDLNSEGAEKFAEATERLLGQKIAIFMDDQLISAPVVNEKIPNGKAVITGQRDAKEAGQLAATIRSGSLPFRMVAKEVNSITPLIGESALRIMIIAGVVALALIVLFMLIVYRIPGLVASISLFGLVVLTLLAVIWFGITLTLPGIAGIILTMGMGVDANVIVYERIKEELKSGKTLKASIDVGFKRAFTAILDGNITTLITAAVLYVLGSGAVKGFGATLFIGVIISFLTAVTATRIMLKSLSGLKFLQNKRLYGYRGV